MPNRNGFVPDPRPEVELYRKEAQAMLDGAPRFGQ